MTASQDVLLQATESLSAQVEAVETQRLTVLLVEDDEDDAKLVELALAEEPCIKETFVCSHLAKAEDALARPGNLPDVILLDLHLPDSQGLDTLRRTKALCGGTPVIVLTGLSDKAAAIAAASNGAHDYVLKDHLGEGRLALAIRYAVACCRCGQDLRGSISRFHNLVETSPDGIVITDKGRSDTIRQSVRVRPVRTRRRRPGRTAVWVPGRL